jgi:hypothetical protein
MTPLFKKLNLGAHSTLAVLNSPDTCEGEFEEVHVRIQSRHRLASTRLGLAPTWHMSRAELAFSPPLLHHYSTARILMTSFAAAMVRSINSGVC